MHTCKIIEYVLHAKETVKDTEIKWMDQALIVPAHKDQTRRAKARSRPGLHSKQWDVICQHKLQRVTLVGFVKLVDKHIKTALQSKTYSLAGVLKQIRGYDTQDS